MLEMAKLVIDDVVRKGGGDQQELFVEGDVIFGRGAAAPARAHPAEG